jgi:hypothetical protein
MTEEPFDILALGEASQNREIRQICNYIDYLHTEIQNIQDRISRNPQTPSQISPSAPPVDIDRKIQQALLRSERRIDYDEIDRRIDDRIREI